MTTSVTSRQIARLRLHTLGLVPGSPVVSLRTPLEVVRHHLAMQSQDWGASRWAIGSRLPHSVDADVLAAYDAGEIVRSWPMRGTVHAVVAEDLRWMLDLMGVRVLSAVARRWEVLGIDAAEIGRARDVVVTLLRGGGRCTRAELGDALRESGIELGGQRAYHVVWYLAQEGTLVLGPTRDGEQELVLLEEWVPNPRKLSREEALAELGRRYLTGHGPATVEDLVHWTKLTKGDARLAFAACDDELVRLERGGVELFMLREQFEQIDRDDRSVDAAVLALAGFDEHLLGYRVRDDVLNPDHATLVDPGRNGVFRWTIVAGSRVVATWSRTKRARSTKVAVRPLTALTKGVAGRVAKAIDAYGRFVGRDMEVTIE